MKSICGRDCSLCIFNERCGSCSMCEMPLCSKNCKNCFALCFKKPQSAGYLKSIGGPDISLQKNKDLILPAHIPILPDRMTSRPEYKLIPLIAVHGGNAFNRKGLKVFDLYTRLGFQGALNVDPETAGILEFYVRDTTLEGFWDNRKSIYSQLKKLNLLAIMAPNFSVYDDSTRLDHMYNIKRSTIVYNELLDSGINAIPDVSWFNIKDLDTWCECINTVGIKNIAFSFQVVDVALKASNVWKSYLTGFRYLCENIPPDVRITVAGMVSPFRIQEVFRSTKGQKLSILNQSAFIQSRKGMLSETREKKENLTFDELFYLNITYFNKLYSSMNEIYSSSQKNIYELINSWDSLEIKEFYLHYEAQKEQLKRDYNLSDDIFENVIMKVIDRIAKKKKIQTNIANEVDTNAEIKKQ